MKGHFVCCSLVHNKYWLIKYPAVLVTSITKLTRQEQVFREIGSPDMCTLSLPSNGAPNF